MNRRLFCLTSLAALLAVLALVSVSESRQVPKSAGTSRSPTASAGKESPRTEAGDVKDRTADEAAIRANVAAFVKGYNAHEAAAVAKLFGPQAKIVTEEGDVIEGREAIAELFVGVFADEPETKLDVIIGSIKFIGSDLAVETGTTKTVAAPGESPEHGRYTVLHLKRDGQWVMALVRDEVVEPPTNHDRLQALGWLVGDWIDESEESVVMTCCRWSEDGNFLLQDIKLRVAGVDAMDISQRIGWDPLTKRIKSWVFDSEGGYGDGIWTRTADGWLIKSTGVRRDATTASATNLMTTLSRDAYVWRSVDRVAGDAVLPPVEVRVVRKAPPPAN